MNFDEFLKLVSKIENIALPAEASQLKMVPPFRRELIKQQKDKIKHAKKAGILVLFYPDLKGATRLVLILRKTYNGVHSAQVGFPGGKLEPQDENLRAAAVRETYEEIGVLIKDIEVIRELSEVYIPPSNFFVQPFIGLTRATPDFVKQENEVEDILEIELSHFLNDKNLITRIVKTSYSIEVEVPAFKLNNHVVWGATAMMLSEVKDLLKQLI